MDHPLGVRRRARSQGWLWDGRLTRREVTLLGGQLELMASRSTPQHTANRLARLSTKESEVSLGEFLWSLLVFYLIFFYFMILFRIIADMFADPDLSGVGKTLWIIFLLFLPFLAMFVYLITRGKAMTERSIARAHAAQTEQQEYIRQVAGSGASDPTAQIARGQELLTSGAITQQEFDVLKAKALA
jgi:hypothetical protein